MVLNDIKFFSVCVQLKLCVPLANLSYSYIKIFEAFIAQQFVPSCCFYNISKLFQSKFYLLLLSVNSIFDAFDGLFDGLFDGYDEEFYSTTFLFMVTVCL